MGSSPSKETTTRRVIKSDLLRKHAVDMCNFPFNTVVPDREYRQCRLATFRWQIWHRMCVEGTSRHVRQLDPAAVDYIVAVRDLTDEFDST